jgi:hypothetical protein
MLQAEKPRCAVRGMLARGAMCSSVIVGGKFCGFNGACPHKIEPSAIPQATVSPSQEQK